MSDFVILYKNRKIQSLNTPSSLSNEENILLKRYQTRNLDILYLDKKALKTNILDKEKEFIIFFKGFISNILDIKKSYCLQSDNEINVIKTLYKKYGKDFIKFLKGFFSIVIYDQKTDDILIYSDHLCSKPIYYSKYNQAAIFTSNPFFIIDQPFENKNVNKDRLRYYFTTLTGSPGTTFFRNIKKTLPRSFLNYKNNNFYFYEYFKFNYKERSSLKKNQQIEKFKYLFKKSVEQSSEGYHEIGTALSGGLDSSSITSVAASLEKKIFPQTIILNGLSEKETKLSYEANYAKDVVNMHNLQPNFMHISNTGPVSHIDEMQRLFFEPIAGMNSYIHNIIFKNLQRQKISCFLDGYDGDTTVSHGYEKFNYLGKRLRLKKLINELKSAHSLQGVEKFDLLYFIKNYAIKSQIPHNILWIRQKYFLKNHPLITRSKILKKEFRLSYYELLEHFNGKFLKAESNYSKNHYRDITNNAIPMGLEKINSIAEKYNINIRFPFFDRDLMNFCLSLPIDLKLHNGVPRYILRESMKNYIPNTVYSRYTKSNLEPLAKKEILNIKDNELIKFAEESTIVDIDNLKAFVLSSKEENIFLIWMIYSYGKWQENIKKRYKNV